MPKAHEVATELRRFADALDKQPDLIIPRPFLNMATHSKEEFLNVVSVFPRPFYKNFEPETLEILNVPILDERTQWDDRAIHAYACVPRKDMCRLVKEAQPAVYECDPLLDDAELEAINGTE